LRLERQVQAWVGTALTTLGAVSTLWLAATGRLTLYIHPRYTIFTVVMAVLATVLVLAAVAAGPGRDDQLDHDHSAPGHDHSAPDARRGQVLGWVRVAVLIAAALALLVVPPATLSPRMLQNRDIVSAGQRLDTTDVSNLQGGDPATFSLKDWAALLQQGGVESVLGQDVKVSGYVLDQGEEDVFFIARLTVTCCAVDSQPVGLPVSRPNWKQELRPSTWIAVEGKFGEGIGRAGRHPALIQPGTLTRIDPPDNPYVF
jgi:uncharacterized repeat protein (TIGR03943 family)